VRHVSQNTEYPIANFGQLMKALGGKDAAIQFEGWKGTAGHLKEFVPDHYFPVVSEEDLAQKAEDLRARHFGIDRAAPKDAPPQSEKEMPAELRAEFATHAKRDWARMRPPKESEAEVGAARFEDSASA
jgi:hypothetical protein